MKKLVVLTGFMGTGKTETGRKLAEILGRGFVDTDDLIEEKEGISIAKIFESKGEDQFRRCEEEVIEKLVERDNLVVATGGGALLSNRNYELLENNAELVLLQASVEAIVDRVQGDETRPLLKSGSPREKIEALLEARGSAYGRIPIKLDTTAISPRKAALRIAASLDLPCTTIELPVAGGNTRIEIGNGLLSNLGKKLRTLGLDARIFVLIPSNVGALYLEQIEASLKPENLSFETIPVLDGDAHKNLDQVKEILDWLARSGATRDSVIVAVGGGVTGDLCGFAASIYMRGIPLVHVPTTLLAQVDASIGGKTGVNHPNAKNLIGTFYPPRLVLSDPCTLRSLPREQVANGMAEVVKTALLGSKALFEHLEKNSDDLERCVRECAAVKAGVVERDPLEKNERRILNLGHTLGHAFEALGGYGKLLHGQAVSIGMVAALRIAVGRGLIDEDLLHRTIKLLERCGLPVTPPPVEKPAFMKSLHLDKKKRDGKLHFVLPQRLGSCIIVNDVTEEEINRSLEA